MNIIKDETGVYAELPKDSIKFESKEAEIMYDLTLENDRLQQELEEIKKEHSIMKQFIYENGLWKKFLNDDRFIKHLRSDE